MTLFTEDFLAHHGVKGMKWGVRRYQSYATHPRKSGKLGVEIGKASKNNTDTNKKAVANKILSDYGDQSIYSKSFRSAIIAESIRNGLVSTKMNTEHQSRHLLNSKGYAKGRSYIDADEKKVAEEIQRLCLTGHPSISADGSWRRREYVTSDTLTGVVVDENTGKPIETTHAFTLHYSKTGTHLVPVKERDTN